MATKMQVLSLFYGMLLMIKINLYQQACISIRFKQNKLHANKEDDIVKLVKKYSFILLLTFLIFNSIGLKIFGGNDIHSVITYNIKYDDNSNGENSWKVRKGAMIELITTISPDILGIQEALIHQVEFLNSKMSNHKYVGVGEKMQIEKVNIAQFFQRKKI